MRDWLGALAGLCFGLLVAELLVRGLLLVTDVSVRLAHRFGPDSERLGWLLARKQRGPDTVFVEDAELGWVAHPGTFRGADWSATVGPLGAREPAPASMARTPGRVRVAAFGDSFGFGWDQDDDKAWAAALMRRLPQVEVVNLSVCGHDTGQAWLRYLRDGRAWQPDVVLLAYNKLLVGRTVEPFTMYQRPLVPAELGVFTPINVPVPPQDALERSLWWRPQLALVLGMARHALWDDPDARYGLAARRSTAILERFAADVTADGRVMVVGWFPYAEEVAEAAEGRRRDDVRRCPTGTPGVLCVDPTPRLVALHRAGVAVERGTHWSDAAADAVADALAEALRPLVPAAPGAAEPPLAVDP